jgi:FkbM family methyltransferase
LAVDLIRFVRDPIYRSAKRWRWKNGDETLAVDFPLNASSHVVDVGAFEGNYARRVSSRYGCRIDAFEPVHAFAESGRRKSEGHPNIHFHEIGLSNRNGSVSIQVDGPSSGLFIDRGTPQTIHLRDVVEVFSEMNISNIDLMAMNIEGSEYDVIPRMFEAKLLRNVRFLLVQFHDLQPDHRERYLSVADLLQQGHALRWRFPFIWELWESRE